MTPTPQEEFWAGPFGDAYLARNETHQELASKTALFARILRSVRHRDDFAAVLELGAGTGMNLEALRTLLPAHHSTGIELHPGAFDRLTEVASEAVRASFLEWEPTQIYDLAFTFAVLICLAPEQLPIAYDRLAAASHRYVLMVEYYSPSPVMIPYRGFNDRLFKRDFAGEFMARHPAFTLVDYGFVYHGDPVFPMDDFTWFLMERQA